MLTLVSTFLSYSVMKVKNNISEVQTFFQLLESATKGVSQSLDQHLSQMTVDTDTGMLKRLFDDQIDYKIMKHFRR